LCYKHKNQSCKPLYGHDVHYRLVNIKLYNISVDFVRLQGDNVHHSMDDIEFYNVSVDIVREKIDFNNYDYMDLSL